MISNEWEIMKFLTSDQPSEEPFSMYLSGFWLEGADWDVQSGVLIETTRRSRFVQFPVIKLAAISNVKKMSSHGRNTGNNSPVASGDGSSY